METSFIKTTTADGLQFTGLLTVPNQQTQKLILHVHGMSGDIYINSFYPAMHDKYPANGYAFLAVEHRGTHSVTQFNHSSGEIINIGNSYEIFEDSVLDIQAWVDKAVELGYEEIWLQGHSLGPSKLAYYIHKKNPQNIKGLILISPSDMLGWVLDDSKTDLHNKLLAEATQLVAQGKPRQLVSQELNGYLLSAGTYLNFFSPSSSLAIFNYLKPEFGWKTVNSLNLPVIALSGTEDDGIPTSVGAYKAMQMLEEQLINSPRKQTVVYEGAEHDFAGYAEKLVEDILKFVRV